MGKKRSENSKAQHRKRPFQPLAETLVTRFRELRDAGYFPSSCAGVAITVDMLTKDGEKLGRFFTTNVEFGLQLGSRKPQPIREPDATEESTT